MSQDLKEFLEGDIKVTGLSRSLLAKLFLETSKDAKYFGFMIVFRDALIQKIK